MPAYGNYVLTKGSAPVAPITKFRFVKATGVQSGYGDGNKIQVTAITANTDVAIGVAQEAITAVDVSRGKGLPIAEMGITEMEAGSVVAAGDQIATDSVGRATTLGASGAGTVVFGVAMTSAAAIGNRVAVRLIAQA